MGDKLAKVSQFHGFAVPNQTLSESFSIDSFVTTSTRLSSLRVLSLVSLGIWGPLPDKIHRLYSLEVLDMSSNFVFGSIPLQISRLVKLHTLTFDGNFFNKTVPDRLDSLSNLTILSIKNNQLKGPFPSSICKITTLTDIALSHNEISGKFPDLSALSGLHLLDMRENGLDSELPPMPKGLTTVLLSKNSFSGMIPAQFGKLNQLQHLDLSFNLLRGVPPAALFSLPNISYINLASNILSGSLPDQLSCGDELGYVDVSSNGLTGSLPSCLASTSDKRIGVFGGNCLSIDKQNQLPESYCKAYLGKKQSNRKAIGLLVGVIGGTVVVVVVLLVLCLLILRRRYSSREAVVQHIQPKVVHDIAPSGISSELLTNAIYRVFSLEELEEATNDFNQSAMLGESSTGKLFKGRLENETCITIRSLPLFRKCSIRNLKLRLDLLSKLRHPHLVGFLGYCIDGGGQDDSTASRVFLVYEYVSNGNYRAHLSETSPEKVLKWSDRLAVLIGVAKAVHFLHTGVKGGGPKSWNRTKLEDDVYNFGFILLESLVGPIASGKGEAFLLNEMASFGSQDGRKWIVDPVVLTSCSQESL